MTFVSDALPCIVRGQVNAKDDNGQALLMPVCGTMTI